MQDLSTRTAAARDALAALDQAFAYYAPEAEAAPLPEKTAYEPLDAGAFARAA
ncbi:hypothetical protein [Salipiger sp.]|uniref:hypothetical protein n=1 Tax=Salipiger sp. TaxID=2078585 RepID=UPI003A977C71